MAASLAEDTPPVGRWQTFAATEAPSLTSCRFAASAATHGGFRDRGRVETGHEDEDGVSLASPTSSTVLTAKQRSWSKTDTRRSHLRSTTTPRSPVPSKPRAHYAAATIAIASAHLQLLRTRLSFTMTPTSNEDEGRGFSWHWPTCFRHENAGKSSTPITDDSADL